MNQKINIVDLSADFRLDNFDVYTIDFINYILTNQVKGSDFDSSTAAEKGGVLEVIPNCLGFSKRIS